eukprot:CAMPEP_0204575182 /NCGR_PEP_ID=MMETSP0661-20131031/41026_1 /ASSEMBLY_ACC=CAM_ASM_000606 /TAXON_ID=109239 /ORGANISM="Alexandrium margalefi, Strain AMGDE01CS-322" /LENGTH=736 /DNA_ID=CAMNT_0051583775 /DNA_START=116 /DNA_END=2326 /DNA_ORIENTATION=-
MALLELGGSVRVRYASSPAARAPDASPATDEELQELEDDAPAITSSQETLSEIMQAIGSYGAVDERADDHYGAAAAVDALEASCGWDPVNSNTKRDCLQDYKRKAVRKEALAKPHQAFQEMDVVVPTIRDMHFLEAWKPFLEHAHIIVIQDGDPDVTLHIPQWVDFELYNRNDIRRILGDRAWIISAKDASVRNFGFLVSKKKYIFTLDDDVFPASQPDGSLIDAFLEHYRNLASPATPHFFNTLYDPYGGDADFVRGYPYSLRGGVATAVSHGIWLNVPDYDAPTQLLKPLERNRRYVDATITVPTGALYPMCSMNLAFDRERIGPAIMQGLMGDGQPWGRYDDMFAGWASKVCADHLDLGVKSGKPYIHHNKASNPFTNLKKEYQGLLWQEKLIPFFRRVNLTGSTPEDCYTDLATKLDEEFREVHPYFGRLSRAMKTWVGVWRETHAGTIAYTPSRTSKADSAPASFNVEKRGIPHEESSVRRPRIPTAAESQARHLIFVMITYPRDSRIRQLCSAFRFLETRRNLKLVLVEDGNETNTDVANLLSSTSLDYTYLNIGPTHDKGNVQRNLALEHIRRQGWKGVVYNSDDDNVYNASIFNLVGRCPIDGIGIMAVGNIGNQPCNYGSRMGRCEHLKFRANKTAPLGYIQEAGMRRLGPIDMASFTFDANLLQGVQSPIWTHQGRGGEPAFVRRLLNDNPGAALYPLGHIGDNVTEMGVWHNQNMPVDEKCQSIH